MSLVFFSTAWTRSTLFASIRLLMSLMLLWREERRHRPGYQPQTAEQSSIHSPLECSTVQKHQMWETLQEEAWSLKGVLSPEPGCVLAQQWRHHVLKETTRKNKCTVNFPSSTFPVSSLSSSIYACIMFCDVTHTSEFTSTFGFHSTLPCEKQYLIYTQCDTGT